MKKIKAIIMAIGGALVFWAGFALFWLFNSRKEYKKLSKEVDKHNAREDIIAKKEVEHKEAVASRDRLDPVSNLNGLRNPKK